MSSLKDRGWLFDEYRIKDGHKQWDDHIDNWNSVEIYRHTHNGQLPPNGDTSVAWVVQFMEKTKDPSYFFSLPNQGSLYTTAKRMIYRYADQILAELSQKEES